MDRRIPVVIGVAAPGKGGPAAGIARATADLEHKLNGHDGTHPSCRACQYVRMLGAERALEAVPEAFGR